MIARYLLLGTALLYAQTDTTGRAYDKLEGRWNRALAAELIPWAAPPETTKFLDYGCTTGAVALRLGVKYPLSEVVGLDPDPAYVQRASLQTARAKVRFQAGDLIKLPFRSGEFDSTFSIGGISRASDPNQAISEMKRVTKPEGLLATAVWDYGANMLPLNLFWNAATSVDPALSPADGANTPFSKKGQLEELWIAAGLRDVAARSIEVQVPFNNFDDYWTPFLNDPGAAGQWLRAQTEEKRNAVKARLRERVLGTLADAPFTLRARAWVVKGIVRYQ